MSGRWRFLSAMLSVSLLALGYGQAVAYADEGEQQPQLAFLSGDIYADEGVEIYLAGSDGSAAANVSQGGVGSWYDWSPDGSSIGFLSARDGTMRLYLARLDGAPPVAVAQAAATPAPRWSPDGSLLAFVDGAGALRAIDPGTHAAVTMASPTTGPTGGSLRWSPTGLHVAFERDDDLYLAVAAGGAPAHVAAHFTGAASWSPEGDRLLFVADPIGNSDIFVADMLGAGGIHQLSSAPGDEVNPTWSGDGTRIAYTAGFEIMVVDADGSNTVSATRGPLDPASGARVLSTNLGGPVWAPNGDTITTVAGVLPPSPSSAYSVVYRVDPEGVVEPAVITTGRGNASTTWSRDGDRLMVSGQSVYGPYTEVFDAAGQQLFGLTAGSGATWSPDRSMIAYAAGSTAPQAVWVVDADGTNPREVGVELDDPFGYGARWRPESADAVGLVDVETGRWYLRGTTGRIHSFYFGDPGDVPFMGDWNCDGIDSPGLYRQTDGYVYLRNSNSQGVADIAYYFGNPGDVPLAGDFDADGCDTVSIYRPSEQRFYVIDHLGTGDAGLGAASFSFVFGDPGDQPVVGDWDGDGTSEVGLHRPGTGYFYWRDTLTTGIADGAIFFGDPGDGFIAGDWIDHDGRDTPAVYRPDDATFYFRSTLTQGTADDQLPFGRAGWIPITGIHAGF